MVSRRDALQGLAAAALGRSDRLGAAPVLLAKAEGRVTPELVRFRSDMEPLVVSLERAPRERCAETLVDHLRRGVSYRQLMAALFLAGIRNINPRPPGFALHCVFVIHSAHLIGLEAPPELRLLPLFYALDNFKAAQDRDARAPSGDYAMRELRGALPVPERCRSEFSAAMDAWDIERAERAVASLARYRSAAEVFEMLWQYGARDYRNIGHKAIFVANACRTLHAIGWQHAEPVLRSLVLGLLDFGRQQKVNGYAFDDQCYAGNLRRLKETFPRLDGAWVSEHSDPRATRGVLELLRGATPEEACADVSARLAKRAASAGAIWDGAHLAAAEIRMRLGARGAIVGIHAVTAANALHHAYLAASEPSTRFLALMQAVGWISQFRTWAATRGEGLREHSIDGMEPSTGEESPERALAAASASIPDDLDAAAARVFRLVGHPDGRQAFLNAALRSTIMKADEVHYYKYAAALVEDAALVSPEWRPHLYAAMVYYMKGSQQPHSPPMARAVEALRALPASL